MRTKFNISAKFYFHIFIAFALLLFAVNGNTQASKKRLPAKKTAASKPAANRNIKIQQVPKGDQLEKSNFNVSSTIYLFSTLGGLAGPVFKGLHVGNQMVLFKLDDSVSFTDLIANYKAYLLFNDESFLELNIVTLDFERRIAVMKLVSRLPNQATFQVPKSLTPGLSRDLGFSSVNELNFTLNQVRRNFDENSRSAASVNSRNAASIQPDPMKLLEDKAILRARRLANEFIQANDVIKFGKYSLSVRTPQMQCRPSSPKILSAEIQEKISTARSLDCVMEDDAKTYSDMKQSFDTKTGVFSLKNEASLPEDIRLKILQELTHDTEISLKGQSQFVQYSTKTLCEKSVLTDQRVDVYFCSRNSKIIPSLSESFVVMGTQRGKDYLFSSFHSAGFSSDLVQSLSNKVIQLLGRNL